MKAILILVLTLIGFSARADFATGFIMGSMLSSNDSGPQISLNNSIPPCLITLKKTGGEYTLNANFIKSLENVSLENCVQQGLFGVKCSKVSGTRISLINGENWLTYSSTEEIKTQSNGCFKAPTK